MNRPTLIIMGAALLLAVLTAMIVQRVVAPKNTAGPVKTQTEILVTTKKLMIGEKIKPEDVRWQPWPDGGLFTGVYKHADYANEKDIPVYGTPLRRTIESGEPITAQAIIADVKGDTNFLAASLTPGMRAYAISVKANTATGGFVTPGDHVDIILTYQSRNEGQLGQYASNLAQSFATQTVLSNVKVLAVDQKSNEENRNPSIPKTVTLEVTKQEAETLAIATSLGEISLALRRIGDKDPPNEPFDLTSDLGTLNTLKAAAVMQRQSRSVRLYGGTNIVNVPVRAAD